MSSGSEEFSGFVQSAACRWLAWLLSHCSLESCCDGLRDTHSWPAIPQGDGGSLHLQAEMTRSGGTMVSCVVCHYWSERLKDARAHTPSRSGLDEEIRLTARLQDHQRHGACAARSPRFLRDLIKQEELAPISDSELPRGGISILRRYQSIPSSNCCNSVPLA